MIFNILGICFNAAWIYLCEDFHLSALCISSVKIGKCVCLLVTYFCCHLTNVLPTNQEQTLPHLLCSGVADFCSFYAQIFLLAFWPKPLHGTVLVVSLSSMQFHVGHGWCFWHLAKLLSYEEVTSSYSCVNSIAWLVSGVTCGMSHRSTPRTDIDAFKSNRDIGKSFLGAHV